MASWTEEGWELLEGLALNAAVFTGFNQSAFRLIDDALRVCDIAEKNPGIGKKIKNIYDEDRFWHPFHDGKILIWKVDSIGLKFTGAFYSLPDVLVV